MLILTGSIYPCQKDCGEKYLHDQADPHQVYKKRTKGKQKQEGDEQEQEPADTDLGEGEF